MPVTALAVVLAMLALPQPAVAWWDGGAIGPGVPGGYAWTPGRPIVFPFQRPHPEYRYSRPPGVPLSYDDPHSGATYCWSQTTGFYFVCAFGPPSAVSSLAPPPPPPGLAPPPREQSIPPASGVLLFRLPRDARASINGVPIGLSKGLGIHALPPGTHQVVLHVAGKDTAHTVSVLSHKIFMVTPAGVAATEP